jgi:hypothetical protein
MATVNPKRHLDPESPQALCEQISASKFPLLRLPKGQWRHQGLSQ